MNKKQYYLLRILLAGNDKRVINRLKRRGEITNLEIAQARIEAKAWAQKKLFMRKIDSLLYKNKKELKNE